MRRMLARAGALLVCALLALCSTAAAEPAGAEMIAGGDFEGALRFSLYTESGGDAAISITDGALTVNVAAVGTVPHAVQPYYDGFSLEQGAEYELSWDVRSTLTRSMYVRIQINGEDYHSYFEREITATEEAAHMSERFIMNDPTDPAPRLCVNMGYVDAMRSAGQTPNDIPPHQVTFDNFSLKRVDDDGAQPPAYDTSDAGIRVNQVGYLPDAPKTAVFAGVSADSDTFAIVDAESGEVVYQGTLGAPADNRGAMEVDRIADFSDLRAPGVYCVVSADGVQSPAFRVAPDVYADLNESLVRMLRLQRCGEELTGAGPYDHPACHTELATVYGTDQRIDVSGGWHDAGDYGRYVVSGAKTVADLLIAYEWGGSEELLREADYELAWMLKMQAASGGVYHKVTCRTFPGFVMPEEETDELVVCPISNTATGDFAAVMAMAARVFSACGVPELQDAAPAYLDAAKRAWAYLHAHQGDPGFLNPSDVVTGQYEDDCDADEIFWAAAELAKTTGDDTWAAAAEQTLADGRVRMGLGWQNVGTYGLYAVLTDPARAGSELRGRAEAEIRRLSEKAMAVIDANPYAVARSGAFEWGSNMEIANTGMLLIMADLALPDAPSPAAARRQLDYLLGENATGYCFVTGFGTLSPKHPHHRPSVAAGEAMPGMLVGGPDSGLHDPAAAAALAGAAPSKCYVDDDQSYSTNEICVYWNSPLIALLAGLNHAQH